MLDDRIWLLIGRKMANEASPQELLELENILRSNPELHFSLQTLSGLWQQAPAENDTQLEEAYSKLLETMKAKGTDVPGAGEEEVHEQVSIVTYTRQSWLRRNMMAVAAGFCGIALAAFLWIAKPFTPAPKPLAAKSKAASEISTRYGSKTNIVLPDGSKVWLNAGSRITYDKDFGETSRNVQLTGEAYFDVVHNAEKPFLIHTRAMDIKVLGTEFNVKSYPDDQTTETSLIRGSIQVTLNDRKADRIILKPNEKLVVSNDQTPDTVAVVGKRRAAAAQKPLISISNLSYFSVDSTILETSWVDNRLVFEDESFQEIAVRMARWYGVTFKFENEELKQLRFTGNFRDESLNDALMAMQITANFGYRISDKNVTITKY